MRLLLIAAIFIAATSAAEQSVGVSIGAGYMNMPGIETAVAEQHQTVNGRPAVVEHELFNNHRVQLVKADAVGVYEIGRNEFYGGIVGTIPLSPRVNKGAVYTIGVRRKLDLQPKVGYMRNFSKTFGVFVEYEHFALPWEGKIGSAATSELVEQKYHLPGIGPRFGPVKLAVMFALKDKYVLEPEMRQFKPKNGILFSMEIEVGKKWEMSH